MFNLPEGFAKELPRVLPWAVHLPEDEQQEMLAELGIIDGLQLPRWAQRLIEWQRTAEVWADPALRARLAERGEALQYRDIETLDALDTNKE